MAEVSVADRIEVKRMFAVIDCGKTVNREIIKQQVEGAIVMGLSVALLEKVSFSGSQNFDSYNEDQRFTAHRGLHNRAQ